MKAIQLAVVTAVLGVSQSFAGPVVYEGALTSGAVGSVVGAGATNCGICGHGDGALTLDFWSLVVPAGGQTVTITGIRLQNGLDLTFGLYSGLTSADVSYRDGQKIWRQDVANSLTGISGLTWVGFADDENPHPIGPYGDPTLTRSLAAGNYTVIVSSGIGSWLDVTDDPIDGNYQLLLSASDVVDTPEPSTYFLLASGLAGAAMWSRRRTQ